VASTAGAALRARLRTLAEQRKELVSYSAAPGVTAAPQHILTPSVEAGCPEPRLYAPESWERVITDPQRPIERRDDDVTQRLNQSLALSLALAKRVL